MQTEEVVPRAQSVTLEDSPANRSVTFQPVLRYEQHIQYPIPSLINMAVKQEPQEEEEQEREASKLSAEIEAVQTPDGPLNSKRGSSDQSSPDCDNRRVAPAPQQNEGKKSNSRARRKSRWKLKFHHQALPPEYLDHYEAALAQEAALSSTAVVSSAPAPTSTSVVTAPAESRLTSPASVAPTTPVPVGAFTSTSHPIVDVQSWLHRLAIMQNEVYPARPVPAVTSQPSLRRSVITSTQSTPQMSQATQAAQPVLARSHHNYVHGGGGGGSNASSHRSNASNQPSQPSPRAPMKYSDLPYMGEITLDNSKPRRGRKPKKADICHLIYKNYGTILPGTPGLEDKLKGPAAMRDKIELKDAQVPVAFQRTDIQNRISSLLEKRLTQERRAFDVAALENAREQDEPLNLCIRDLNLLKLRFAERQSGSFDSCHSKSEGSSETEDAVNLQEVQSRHPSLELLNGLDFNAKRLEGQDNPVVDIVANIDINGSQRPFNSESNEINGCTSEANCSNSESEAKKNAGLLYWPNTALFIHPNALQSQFLYYKKLAEEKGAEEEAAKAPGVSYNALENAKIHPQIVTPVEVRPAPCAPSSRAKRKQESMGALCLPKASGSPGISAQTSMGRTGTTQSQLMTSNQPMKRKRSAIFIPPMPSENNNNPTTEVSICKFKFTGGAKPSLQEKKSLSVDSGGNFRYYSGTGDKSMRGYEFFPREALQQPAHQAGGSSSGAFLTAASERISPQVACSPRNCSVQDDSRRKRKSRKSIQREKLEQTFKEKGFLIQTQQLESAEGATYCKFRQLRKFTRYLFRSWKDYLPGNVRELNADANSDSLGNLKEPVEGDAECLPSSPLAPGNLELEQTFTENSPASLSLN